MSAPTVPDFVFTDLRALGVTLPPEALAHLSRYLDLLLEANRQFNLTAVRDRDAAWRRHIIDSLTLLAPLHDLPLGARVIDVGSGGGLPGIPVAVARPDLHVTLLETTGKKARFLERCVAEMPLPRAAVLNRRAEQAGQDAEHRQGYDAAMCRAVGPMRELLEYTLPLVRVGGVVLAMKGAKVEAELDACGDALTTLGAGQVQLLDAWPPPMARDGAIVLVHKERPTPGAYPRAAGTPRQSPL